MNHLETIRQLGGGRIFAMAFAPPATTSDNSLTLKIAPALVSSARDRATHVIIRLNAYDTYDVEVHRIKKMASEVLEYREGVYADGLRECVERMTGLALTL